MTVKELIKELEKVKNKELEIVIQGTDPTDYVYYNEIEMLVNHFDNYQYPEKILFQANPYKFYNPKIVNPYFINKNYSTY